MSEEIKVAVINLDSGLVENVAVVTEGDGSTAPDGFQFVPCDDAAIGDSWDGAQIVKAPQPAQEIAVVDGGAFQDSVAKIETDQVSKRLDALEARVAALEVR